MNRSPTVASLARIAVTAASLMIIVFLIMPGTASAEGGTSTIPLKKQVSLPFVTVATSAPEVTTPRIISTPALAATVGSAYTYMLETDGNPVPTLSLEQSPEGMTIDEVGLARISIIVLYACVQYDKNSYKIHEQKNRQPL